MESVNGENRIAKKLGLAKHAVIIKIASIIIANQFGRLNAMRKQELKRQTRRLIRIRGLDSDNLIANHAHIHHQDPRPGLARVWRLVTKVMLFSHSPILIRAILSPTTNARKTAQCSKCEPIPDHIVR